MARSFSRKCVNVPKRLLLSHANVELWELSQAIVEFWVRRIVMANTSDEIKKPAIPVALKTTKFLTNFSFFCLCIMWLAAKWESPRCSC